MKIRLFAIMFTITVFAALNVSTTKGQSTQAIRVQVPFAFTANNKMLPAGTYRIESASDARNIWRIKGARKRRGIYLLANGLAPSSRGGLRVTFRRYGDSLFLTGFRTASYEVNVPTSRRERTLQMAQDVVLATEVINLETVTDESR
jgi:hypothetical protein